MIRYINVKTKHGTETVDELDSEKFESFKLFKKELHRLIGEYRFTGAYHSVWSSSRSTNDWRNW